MKKEIITYRTPKSPVSEMFRTLRTNIQFMNTKNGLHSLLVTSTMPGEGKSWVSANLAVTFAQAGKKVILVDADMRKGRQFTMFGVKPTPGLSNYLSGYGINGEELSSNILDYVRETEVENLYLIPSGSIPPNPSELLVSEKTVEMIKTLESVCDLVIFDGTPSIIVTDAVILSRFVDSTVIISSHKQTKMDNLETVKKNIENVGGKIMGVVLNKIPISQKKYESEYYYYGSKTAVVPSKKKNSHAIEKQPTMQPAKLEPKPTPVHTPIVNKTEEPLTKEQIETAKMMEELNAYLEQERLKLNNKGEMR